MFTVNEVVFRFFCADWTGLNVLLFADCDTGVAERLGSWELGVLTVMSLPWVFMRTEGNSRNLASRTLIKSFFAKSRKAAELSERVLVTSQEY